MAKDDEDGKTVLMLAASTGNPAVLELVASRLPRAQVSVCFCYVPSCRAQSKTGHQRIKPGHFDVYIHTLSSSLDSCAVCWVFLFLELTYKTCDCSGHKCFCRALERVFKQLPFGVFWVPCFVITDCSHVVKGKGMF